MIWNGEMTVCRDDRRLKNAADAMMRIRKSREGVLLWKKAKVQKERQTG